MIEQNNNEVLTDQSTAPQNPSAETTAVVSDTTNSTTDKANTQVSQDKITQNTNDVTNNIELLSKLQTLLNGNSKPNFYNGKVLQYKDVAKYMIDKCHIVKLHDVLYIYDRGIYVNDTQLIECIIRRIVPKAKSVDVKLILNELYFNAPLKIETSYKYVAFANRILNVETMEDFEFNPDKYIITSRIYTNYKRDILEANTSNVEFVNSYFRTLSCGDEEIANLYLELLGYSMVRSHKFQVGFLLKGNSNNGKSIYLKLVERLSGKYCSHLNLEQLSNLKSLAGLYNCTANIVDDTSQPKKVDLEQIQSIISGATISIPEKDGTTFDFEPYCTLLLATTNILKFKDYNKSLTRRFKVIPFNANFENDRNDDIEEQICKLDNLSVIAVMALKAFSKVLADGHFHIPEVVEADTKSYFYENNQVMEFVDLYPIKRLIVKGEYFAKYEQWCRHNNKDQQEKDNTFGTKVLALGYKRANPSFDGIRHNYYAAPNFNINKFRAEYEEYRNSLDNQDEAMTILEYLDYLNKQDMP